MDRNTGKILTIGHSNHAQEFFLELLIRHHVTPLVDVRSVPYSRFNPHFDREQLAETLRASGIRYLYLGGELGGRPDDPSCYDENGRIRYDRLAHTPLFQNGLKKIVCETEKYHVSLMCAEKEPLDCHRTLLIGHELAQREDIDVAHIWPHGQPEPHDKAMDRLLSKHNRQNRELFVSRDERIREAIDRQAKKVGLGHVTEQAADFWEHNDR